MTEASTTRIQELLNKRAATLERRGVKNGIAERSIPTIARALGASDIRVAKVWAETEIEKDEAAGIIASSHSMSVSKPDGSYWSVRVSQPPKSQE